MNFPDDPAADSPVIIFFGFAWALAYFLLIESEVMYDRDDVMTENIISIAEEEGYETILVNCGGKHLPGIAATLEHEGWDVDERTTDSWIGKVLMLADKVSAALVHPQQSLQALYSKLGDLK